LDAETGEMLGTQPVLTLVVNAYRMIIAQFVESTTEMGKAQTIEILTEAKTGYKRVDSEIDRIIRNINASLAPELWIDGSRLVFKPKIDWVKEMEAQFKKKGYTVKDEEIDDERYSAKCMPPGKRSGITVFHEERKAAIHMETLLKIYQRELDTSKKDLKEKWKKHFDDLKKAKISNLIKNKIKIVVPRWGTRPDIRDRQAEIQAKINAIAAFKKVLPVLVMVDENLARVAFEDFQNVQPNNPDRWGEHINRELLRSESDYLKGVELGAAEKYSEAIKYFGRSWFHVQLAMQFALKK